MASDMLGNQPVHADEGVSTTCRVYNATGDTVKFITNCDWNGHIEGTYPQEILNGRSGVFQHVGTAGASSGSSAGVVYRGKNRDGSDNDWMLAWSNPGDRQPNRRAYTEIREAQHFKDDAWDKIFSKLNNSGIAHGDEWNGSLSSVIIGSDTSPTFQAILTLKDPA